VGVRGAIWDRVGALAGLACAVHCVLVSVAIGAISVVGIELLHSRWTDWAFVGVSLLVGIFAAWAGHRRHGSWLPATLFVFGVLLIVIGHYGFGDLHWGAAIQWLDNPWLGVERVLTVLGGLTLVAYHLVNSRLPGRTTEQPGPNQAPSA